MSNYKFVTFANDRYFRQQTILCDYANSTKLFKEIKAYTFDQLVKSSFYIPNKHILDQTRGSGYWLWKPYIILETLNESADNECVLYLDCADVFNPGILDYVDNIINLEDCLLLGGAYKNINWTKRDCFYYMDCDEPKYWQALQLEAGVQIWKKTSKSIQCLEEYLEYCKDYRILTDSPNESGLPNAPDFVDHRHDQSVLTNLCVKYNLPYDSFRVPGTQYRELRNYVTCNIYDNV